MIEVLPRSSDKVLGLKISGKLLHADYQKFIPMLEKMIEEHGKFRCLCVMHDCHGIALRAIWDEIKFDTTHCGKIDKCAVVGHGTLEKWMTNMSGWCFPKASFKFFEEADEDKAWEWIEAD